ncbi:hypothetical protein GRI89_14555 [Altererythrobacter salegens]|uniref:GlsB/YeaQ/YmgE family stress response membrane protein n=1 Tax=Croceibacterium salegens TaxID=1737568 RepID=A0A6I4SXN6_9SPHN|nr:hypothetical protein [Croceibacterium salegens]MXO60761.1 hypothetical protein [Croceibacterium salegens]
MAGLAIGWLSVVVRRIYRTRGIVIQLSAGLAGALVGGPLVASLVDVGNLLAGTYRMAAVLLTLVGATAGVAALNMLGPDFARGGTGPEA